MGHNSAPKRERVERTSELEAVRKADVSSIVWCFYKPFFKLNLT